MSLADHAEKLLADSRFTDVVLVAVSEGEAPKEILANSHFLSRCPPFERMFSQGFKEGVQRRAEVKVPSPRLLEQLVKYLHTDKMDIIDSADAFWSSQKLLALYEFLDMYEAPPGAFAITKEQLIKTIKSGQPGAAAEAVRAATSRSVVCGLLGDQLLTDALVRRLERGGYWMLLTAMKDGLRAPLPRSTLDKIADSLATSLTFGDGKVAKVLAWSMEEAAGEGSSSSCNWRRFQEKCLERVVCDEVNLQRECLNARVREGTFQEHLCRAFILAKHAKMETQMSHQASTCTSMWNTLDALVAELFALVLAQPLSARKLSPAAGDCAKTNAANSSTTGANCGLSRPRSRSPKRDATSSG